MRDEPMCGDEYFSYPTALEIKSAQAACCGKCCLSCETPAAYAWRRRDIDMALLLRRAIDRELTPAEKETTMLFWFENMTVAQIAAKQGVHHSAVSRTLARAKDKLYHALSYVAEYQRSAADETVVHTALRRAAVIAAAREGRADSFAGRLRMLRVAENLSREQLAEGLMLTQARLRALEEGKAQPLADEIISIGAYFKKTTDYLLKGDVENEF